MPPTDAALHAEFVQLLATRAKALVQGNAAFFRELLAEEFTYTNASGAVLDRATYLAFYIESGQMQWQTQDWDELQVRRYGEVVVLTGRIHDRATFAGQAFDAYFRSTQVFVKRGEVWQYVAGHTTTTETPTEGK